MNGFFKVCDGDTRRQHFLKVRMLSKGGTARRKLVQFSFSDTVFDRHGLSTLAAVYSFRLYPVV